MDDLTDSGSAASQRFEPHRSESPRTLRPLAPIRSSSERTHHSEFNFVDNTNWIKDELCHIRESLVQTQIEIREKSHRRDEELLRGNGHLVVHLVEDLSRLHEVRCKLLDCQLNYCRLLEQQLFALTPRQSIEVSSSKCITALGMQPHSLPLQTAESIDTIGLSPAHRQSIAQWLLHLPGDVLTALLVRWVTVPDICRLDSAMCNHQLRSHFLSILCSQNMHFDGLADGDYEEEMAELNEWGEADSLNTLDLVGYLHWLNRRRIRVANLKICSSMKRRGVFRLAQTGAEPIIRLRQDITGHGGALLWSPLRLLTPFTCAALRQLHLTGPLVLDDAIFVQAIANCKQLQVASFDFTPRASASFHSASASPVPTFGAAAAGQQHFPFIDGSDHASESPGLSDLAYMRLLYSCPQLTTLEVTGDMQVTGTMLKHITTDTVPHFHTLCIRNCRSVLPVALVQFIDAASRDSSVGPIALRHFTFEDGSAQLDDDVAAGLGATFQGTLRQLVLHKCNHLSHSGLEQLFRQLRVVNSIQIVDSVEMADSVVAAIAKGSDIEPVQRSLQLLHVEGSDHITVESLRHAVTRFIDLEEMRFINCSDIRGVDVETITADTQRLHRLLWSAASNRTPAEGPHAVSLKEGLDSNSAVRSPETVSYTSLSSVMSTGGAVNRKLPQRFHKLKAVDFSHCTALEDSVLHYLSETCPQLRSLNLDLCDGITDRGLQFISSGCPELDTLSLCGCDRVSSEGVLAVTRLCRRLTVLDVSMCNRLTDAFVTGLAVVAPQMLAYVGLMSCNITQHCMEDLFVLLYKCPNLRKLGFDSSDGMITDGAILLQAMFPDLEIR